MERNLVIFGTGSHARKVYQCAKVLDQRVLVFVDESPTAPIFQGVEVRQADQLNPPTAELGSMFIAIGQAAVRERLMNTYSGKGWRFPSLVHPTAYVADGVELKEGVLVAAGAIVESGTRIGRGTIIDIGAVIDHDCQIGDFAHIRLGGAVVPRSVL